MSNPLQILGSKFKILKKIRCEISLEGALQPLAYIQSPCSRSLVKIAFQTNVDDVGKQLLWREPIF